MAVVGEADGVTQNETRTKMTHRVGVLLDFLTRGARSRYDLGSRRGGRGAPVDFQKMGGTVALRFWFPYRGVEVILRECSSTGAMYG